MHKILTQIQEFYGYLLRDIIDERQPHKMVKHTQTTRPLFLTNFLSVFDYFVGLALKWVIYIIETRGVSLFY